MRLLPLVAAAAGATLHTPLAAQAPARDTVAVLMITATHPWLGREGRIADVQGLLRQAAGGTAEAPRFAGWTAAGRPTAAARATLSAIAASSESTPEERADAARLDSIAGTALAPIDDALFGMAMHVVVARHASVRAQGRIDPSLVHVEWNAAPAPLDLARLAGVLQRDDTAPAAAFAQLEPTAPHYRRLVLARETVRALRADSARLVLPAPTAKQPIRPGRRTAGLRDLARLVTALGDLEPGARIDTLRYAAPLADAVQRARRRADRRATPVLDSATLALLHAQLAQRDTDLALAIERWRWLPREHANIPLVVNIPEYRLERWTEWAGDTLAGGLAMNVVVGRADSNATPVFASSMTQVVFSPQWRLPVSIMKKEILPAALGNPGYLRKHAYYLVTARGDELPMTPQNIARIGSGVWVRQRSGGGNALGRVKFNMWNPYDIYLHDTPAKRFFARARRDLSHGCVRLADPVALAKYVLADDDRWTDERIAGAMDGGKETFVGLRKSVPVLLLYHTLVVEPDGAVKRFDDIYGHDARTLAALRGERPAPAVIAEEGAP